MTLNLIIAVWFALLGLIVGSYLNVVIHRVPLGRSTVTPRSVCPFCGGRIRARDNIPVLSYLLLRGRCHSCSAPISPRYPLIEALTSLLFVSNLALFGVSRQAVAGTVFCCLLLVLAAIDLDHFLLPDRITLPGIVVGLALQPWLPETTWLDAVLGVLIGAGLLILLINVWYWLRGEEAMGLGDINMLAMVGAFLGWQGVLVTLFFASLSGALAGVTLMAFGRVEMKSKLPFGLFLSLGALVALFAGPALAASYLQGF